MTMLLMDHKEEKRIKARRALTGADRFDEVWNGVYVMSPIANNEHQMFVSRLAAIIHDVIPWAEKGQVYVGCNVSDRADGWEHNYRCPDVAVFLEGTSAKDCGTHWFGGPDFAVEIVSPRDRSRKKLDFYAKVGVRELMILDRRPWQLELYRLQHDSLELVGHSSPSQPAIMISMVLPLSFMLKDAAPRPQLIVNTIDGVKQWVI